MRFYRTLQKFELISFDLDDTLYDNNPIIAKAELEFAKFLQEKYKLKSECSSLAFWQHYKQEAILQDEALKDDVGLARRHGIKIALKSQNILINDEESQSLVDTFIFMRSKNIYVSDKVKLLLKKLSLKYKLIAISNGNVDIDLIGIKDYFLYDLRPCYKQNKRKPYNDLFTKALDIFNLKPHELLHVGDEPYTDVLGSIYANCQCAYLKRGYGKTSSDISHLKILPTFEIDSILELELLL